MFAYLVIALLLLVVMAWFVLQPFLAPSGAVATAARRPPVVTPPRAPKAAVPVASAVAVPAAPTTARSAPARSEAEIRADVEAAIAARKAAMVRHSCGGCAAPVDPGDAFCRACGARVEEG